MPRSVGRSKPAKSSGFPVLCTRLGSTEEASSVPAWGRERIVIGVGW